MAARNKVHFEHAAGGQIFSINSWTFFSIELNSIKAAQRGRFYRIARSLPRG